MLWSCHPRVSQGGAPNLPWAGEGDATRLFQGEVTTEMTSSRRRRQRPKESVELQPRLGGLRMHRLSRKARDREGCLPGPGQGPCVNTRWGSGHMLREDHASWLVVLN